MSDPTTRTFLAWVRQGASVGIKDATGTSGLPTRAVLKLGVTVNSRPALQLNLALYGPGDVIGIDPRQVIRTEPRGGVNDFEPELLAAVEFDRPDLPWLLTPAAADAQGRLAPWLCLVVVERSRASITYDPDSPLPRLTCQRADLPDLTDSWAWAHTQILGPKASVQTLLGVPEQNLSRLICSQRLRPLTAYLACVVPAFEAGRRAGLGCPPDGASTLALAWKPSGSPTSPTVDLPIYYHWEFATAPQGDFKTLATRIRPHRLDVTLGLREIDVSQAFPNLHLGYSQPGAVLGMLGAASPTGPSDQPSPPGDWDATAKAAFQAALAAQLPGATPALPLPLYGAAQAGVDHLPAAGAQPVWLRELNLDPRHRAAAALGTQVVQRYQEQLMASAWQQAADLAAVNQALRQGQLARTVGQAVFTRLTRLEGTASAPAQTTVTTGGVGGDRLVQITQPLHDRVRASATAPATVASQMATSAPGTASASLAYRRAARPLGPLARRLGATPAQPLPPLLSQVVSGDVVVTPPLPPPAGTVTLDSVSGSAVSYGTITSQVITNATPWWQTTQTVLPRLPRLPPTNGGNGGDGETPWSWYGVPLAFAADLVVFRTIQSANQLSGNWRIGSVLDFDGRPVLGWSSEVSLGSGSQATSRPFLAGVAALADPVTPAAKLVAARWCSYGTYGSPELITCDAAPGGSPGWTILGRVTQGFSGPVFAAALTVADVNRDNVAELVFCWAELPAAGGLLVRYLLTSFEGQAMSVIDVPNPPQAIESLAVAVADVTGHGARDLVILWTEPVQGGAYVCRYRVAQNLTANGTPRSWGPVLTVPGTVVSNQVRAVGVALADLTATGRPDLIVASIEQTNTSGIPAEQARLTFGWDLATTGSASGWRRMATSLGTLQPGTVSAALAITDFGMDRWMMRQEFAVGFQQAAAQHQAYLLGPGTLPPPPPPLPGFTVGQVSERLRAGLDPAVTVAARINARIHAGGGSSSLADAVTKAVTETTAAPGAPDPLRPLLAGPRFPQPMFEPLRELAKELLMPAAASVPADTASLITGNAAFIEAYMVGLNHEMSRELLWRGYPSDGHGTAFQRFWDARGTPAPSADIQEIHLWDPAKPLGQHPDPVGTSPAAMLILLVRAQLLQRYPNVLVSAAQAIVTASGRTLSDADTHEIQPSFRGALDPDIAFFGFPIAPADACGDGTSTHPGYFFIFREHPAEARFGPAPTGPLGSLGKNGAYVARALIRTPFAFAIHATDLLPVAT